MPNTNPLLDGQPMDYSNPEHLEEGELLRSFRDKQDIDAMAEVLSTYNGRLTIWRVLLLLGEEDYAVPVDPVLP